MRLRGPETQLDWLAVGLLWVGAFILAIREGHLPLLTGAPPFLASSVWNLVPLALLTLAAVIFLFRAVRPATAPTLDEGPEEPKPQVSIRLPSEEQSPPFGANIRSPSKWEPNITLTKAVAYLRENPGWNRPYVVQAKDAQNELYKALVSAKATGWGKEHPSDADLKQIPQVFWGFSEIKFETDSAFSPRKARHAYEIHLSLDEMKLIWPPKA